MPLKRDNGSQRAPCGGIESLQSWCSCSISLSTQAAVAVLTMRVHMEKEAQKSCLWRAKRCIYLLFYWNGKPGSILGERDCALFARAFHSISRHLFADNSSHRSKLMTIQVFEIIWALPRTKRNYYTVLATIEPILSSCRIRISNSIFPSLHRHLAANRKSGASVSYCVCVW